MHLPFAVTAYLIWIMVVQILSAHPWVQPHTKGDLIAENEFVM